MATQHKPRGHERIETSNFLMIVLILLAVAVGGIVEIVPLFFQRSTTEAAPGIKPYPALELAGRDIYVREGCYNCHSQMVRPFRAETERYGHYSVAGEFVYDHPFQWGSKRTGPDLHRVGGKYSDEWHSAHLTNPRDLVPESNMPAYPWLLSATVASADMAPKLSALRMLGAPYSDEEIAKARATEGLAGIADKLDKALGEQKAATMWFMQNAMANPNNLGAGAHHYMHIMGIVTLGYFWLKMAKVADAALAGAPDDKAYYQAKMTSASYYAERFLPDAGALRRKLEAGSDNMMALPAEAFATAA